jgi:hypothetical protein
VSKFNGVGTGQNGTALEVKGSFNKEESRFILKSNLDGDVTINSTSHACKISFLTGRSVPHFSVSCDLVFLLQTL